MAENQFENLTDSPTEESDLKEEPKPTLIEEIISWVKVVFTAACIAFVLNTFIIANSNVPTGSMIPTIMAGDRVIGSRLSYRFSAPERGDIAIFIWPDSPEGEKIYYVKRVIGLPGDTVDIIGSHVYLNGSDTPLDEPYLNEEMEPALEPLHFEVPEDSYFMMGDNRNYSSDARFWKNHYVHRDKITAKVLFSYFPRFRILK
ncbi:signal peptidase I [Lachnospiraceae bacterium 62-35]